MSDESNKQAEKEACLIEGKLKRNKIKKVRLNKALKDLELIEQELRSINLSKKNEQ